MAERFIYNRRDFYADNIKGVCIFSIFIFSVTFFYFLRPYHRDELPIALCMAVGFITILCLFIHVYAVVKEKEEIILTADGILQKRQDEERLFAWSDIASVQRIMASKAASCPNVVVVFHDGKKLNISNVIKHDTGDGGIEELHQLILARTPVD